MRIRKERRQREGSKGGMGVSGRGAGGTHRRMERQVAGRPGGGDQEEVTRRRWIGQMKG